MFQIHDENGYTVAVPGIQMKTLVYGDKTLMAEFLLDKDSRLPQHSHPHKGGLFTGNDIAKESSGIKIMDFLILLILT